VLLAAFGLLAGCGFRLGFDESGQNCAVGELCPDGQPDGGTTGGADAGTIGDGDGGIAAVWRVDSADELGAGTVSLAAIQSRGALEPIAYYTGGLLARGSDSGSFSSGVNTTWEQIQTFPFTSKIAVARESWFDWGDITPPGVGLTDADNWTVTYEGEIHLEAGSWTFSLYCDDHGFLEIADPQTGQFERVISADWPNPSTGSFSAAANAWYPIRWATSDGGGGSEVLVQLAGPGILNPTAIPHDRLRFRADDLRGLVQIGFDEQRLTGDYFTTIDSVAPANIDWVYGRPDDLGLADSEDFSTRWTGQLRVDIAGDYSFRYNSDDGQRLWIDGVQLLDAWDSSTHVQTSAAIWLEPGWHEIVIDQSDHIGSARALLTVASGPDLVGQPLPVDRLRPVEGRAERFEGGSNHSDIAIPDNGTSVSSVTLTAGPGAVVHGLDVMYRFTHTYEGDLIVTLVGPNNQSRVLRNMTGANGTGGTELFHLDDFDGVAIAGTWRLVFVDAQSQDVGTIQEFQITAHRSGGEPIAPPTASYESPIRDLGGVGQLTSVTWEGRSPAGTGIAISLRSCATATGCAEQPWAAVTTVSGAPVELPPERFVQYRVELTSTADRSPSLEWIQLDFAAP
jgi:subtilisin-like proprotein convertase family protein